MSWRVNERTPAVLRYSPKPRIDFDCGLCDKHVENGWPYKIDGLEVCGECWVQPRVPPAMLWKR